MNMIQLRATRGWSQEALVFEARLHRTFVVHVERLATALGVPIARLIKP